MGHLIEKVAIKSGYEITVIIDNEDDWIRKIDDFQKVDVAIDFSMPSVAVNNIKRTLKLNIPIVIGTTGWLDNLNEIETECNNKSGKILYGANFSIGVNILFKLNNHLTKLMNNYSNYQVSMREIHHIHKKDAPSGTAIHIAQNIINNSKNLDNWKLVNDTYENNNNNIIPITAVRKDDIPGTHEIFWTSNVDQIEIKHTAYSREGFAQGAILAARWLLDKPCGIYEFSQIFDNIQ